MKTKDFIINFIPFLMWMLIFMISLTGVDVFIMHLLAVLVFPIIVSIYNTISSENSGELIFKNLVQGCFNVLGIAFSTIISQAVKGPDSKGQLVIGFYMFVVTIYIVILTAVCCGIKVIINRK